jgi:hypothetical protein
MDVEMTRDQVIDLLNTSTDFAIDFILWNNPDELYAMYESITHQPIPSDQDLKDYLIKGIDDRNESVIQMLNIPYISNVSNWTAGFDSYFLGDMNFMDPNNGPTQRSINWGNFLGAIGAIGTALGSAINTNNLPPPVPLTPEQQLAAAEAAAKAQKEKEAAERTSKIITWSIIGGIVLLLGILATVFLSGDNKEPVKKPA